MVAGAGDRAATARERRLLAYVGGLDDHVKHLLDALGDSGYDVRLVDEVGPWCRQRSSGSSIVLIGGGQDDVPVERIARIATQVAAECRIVVLAELHEGFDFLAAVQAGASGFCAPDAPIEAIVRTIDDVVRYGAAMPRSHVGALIAQLRHGRGRVVPLAGSEIEVTNREWDVLSRLCSGMSTADISRELYVSTATVRSHVKALVGKFGVRDRADLVALFGSAVERP
jgi:DNA-binding NarL/FixJ family response regulator